jgi:hypothetical protein
VVGLDEILSVEPTNGSRIKRVYVISKSVEPGAGGLREKMGFDILSFIFSGGSE